MPDGSEKPTHKTFRFGRTFRFGNPPPADPEADEISGPVRRIEWRLGGDSEAGAGSPPEVPEPATYYEAFTGNCDPHRGFFITGRRVLGLLVWAVALGMPLVLVTLGVIAGESFETILFMGLFGLIVGMLFKSSFPRFGVGR